MNNILMDKLCEKMLASFGVTGEAASSSSLTAERLREMLDGYFDDIVDGRQAMPKSLCKVLCKAYESFHEESEESGSPMGEFWESLDAVRESPPSGHEAKIASLFPGATPEETMVLRQLSTEKSLSEHAKALGMDARGLRRIIKRIASGHE